MISISRLENITEADVESVTRLLKQLSTEPEKERGITSERFHSILSIDTTHVFVVRNNENIVGMATVVIEHIPSGTDGSIEDVVIDEEYRGKGLGEQLMRVLIACAKEHGVQTLYVSSRPFRTDAHALYEKVGFKAFEARNFEMDL